MQNITLRQAKIPAVPLLQLSYIKHYSRNNVLVLHQKARNTIDNNLVQLCCDETKKKCKYWYILSVIKCSVQILYSGKLNKVPQVLFSP